MDAYGWVERLETSADLDGLVEQVEQRVPNLLREGRLREQLAGTWLGHALHPLLTDLPLGMWMSATVLDLLGSRRWHTASTTLTGLGLAAAVPTAVTGVVDWLDTDQQQRRVGVVHAAVNSSAALLYLASFMTKLAGRRGLGTATAVAGGLVATAGGYLGAHLSFGRGAGVDRTVQQRELHDPFPVTPVDGATAVEATGLRYLVTSVGGSEVAVPDRCTRCGRDLARQADGVVGCRHDGSRFDAAAGTIERGPATTPLPRFEVTREGDRTMLRPLTGTGNPRP